MKTDSIASMFGTGGEAAAGRRAIDRSPGAVVHSWITTVDHKRLGIMYILYGFLFLIIGGIEAMLIRLQLAVPDNHWIGPETFNRLFTMHGTTMIFLAAMPFVFGFGNYLIPLMIGARDLAFPRLNAFGFWLTVFGGFLLYYSLIGGEGMTGAGSAPDVGWFAYSPLTARAFSKGHSTDYWILGILVGGFGSIATAVNLVTSILCLRCPGMTLMKMPLLAWLYLVVSGMVLLAISPLTAAQIMLLLDRYLGSHFFDVQAGGSAILWMHFFWIFGHPEVYILVLPAFAFASEIIPVFSRKAIFGYPAMVAATVTIGFVSVSVWAHHMFAVGLSSTSNIFYAGRRADGNQNLQLDRHDVGRPHPLRHAHAVQPRFSDPIFIGGPDGHHALRGTLRLAVDRFVLRRRAFSLRDRRGHHLHDFRGDLLLVPEGHREDVKRTARAVAFCPVSNRFSPHLRYDACPRHPRDAPSNLYLWSG
jgi:hypothetical protein